ncbi:hypothetical protein PPYR_13220 [Photinus pyralis]|uniref:PH domain-containing protein n=1 Tax=Photinus pyralis TaxID=7054 RepID=A0A5N4A8F3_PHOPY|nr:uncharacterized protein LOC116179665 [Photinus pyralis]XP_031355407.1 uncharacterized protein LOC116179725 [Photinus pyralis]KAB0793600.1 hypothetical protein PPYR_13220 [Photinus pyralis]
MANTPQSNHRISGYLEKKAKLRLGSPWKKYWFVLEGRLLLYYRSKDEYESLSPCKGSINLCPPCNVKPAMSVSGVFQIECRASTIILRAEDRSQQEQWMQSLLSAIAQPQSNSNRMSHFRYSLDDLPIPNQKPGRLCRQNTMPHRNSPSSKDIIERLQKIGAQTYRVTTGAIAKITQKDQNGEIQKSQSAEQLPQYSVILEENSSEKNNDIGVSVDNEHYVASAEVDEENHNTEAHIRTENQRNVDHMYDRCSRQSLEDGYSTVDKFKDTEHEVSNDQYVITDNEFLYCAIDNPKEALYEDPENLKVEPSLPPRPHLRKHSEDAFSQASSNEDTNKRKKSKFLFRHLRKYDKKLDEELKKKPKSRTASFLKRVWKRKAKSIDAQEDVAYEAIDYEVIEKQIQQNKNDLQMLQELQDILESRKCILQERLKSNSQRATRNSLPNVDKLECVENWEDRKNEEVKPSIPPKQLSPSSTTLSPSDSLNNNEIKSIDEILEDLDKEKEASESKQKVKELIEKFEVQNEDDVKMRPKSKQLHFIIGTDSCSRHSEGLNELLEKLCKVTCAPVLKPGVTSSLVTPTLTDEEWLKVMPIRYRRLSEPDYDIPRSHRSLHLPTPAKTSETPIIATRFFGPILIPEARPRGIDSKPSTMDPDSLEVDRSDPVSHNFQKEDQVIYAQPKSLSVGVEDCAENMPSDPDCDKNANENLEGAVAVKEEMFVDSLEPLVEISTIF